ncbi:nucleotide-diphospho-sugar transferase [Stipitochalara longipes BDJ]|nr:nucleotide-diphospho-sugar transferase [Stipitochalara longipes BDJ]
MGGHLPKQFLLLAGEPILFHAIRCFHTFDLATQIIISLPEDWLSYWQDLCRQYQFAIVHEVVAGGKERFHSVQNALQLAKGDLIAVHDGVRPFPSLQVSNKCFEIAETHGSAIPVVELKESLREITGDCSTALVRNRYRLVQTPQVFRSEVIRSAYAREFHDNITDDASLVEALGIEITLIQGNDENIKITSPIDLILAEAILKSC